MPLLLKLRCRTVLVGLASLSASTLIGGDQVMPTIEPNTLKRRGVGLRALDHDRASPGFTLFTPLRRKSNGQQCTVLPGHLQRPPILVHSPFDFGHAIDPPAELRPVPCAE